MEKKSTYTLPTIKIYAPDIETICGVKMSEAQGNTGYDDISNIGGDDDDVVPPSSNNIWYDGNEE